MAEFLLGELFCGPGGMALGAKLAKQQTSSRGEAYSISHVWGVDRDAAAIRTYNANAMGEGVEFDAMDFVELAKGRDHKTIADFPRITALAFGFPCNDFSAVGERKGANGAFGNLYKAGIKALRHSNPKWFIAENVSGIHSANAGETFRRIQSEMAGAGKHGYNLTVHLYKFEEYGVPQYRHRFIIVGIRKDMGFSFKVPAPTHLGRHVPVRTALELHYTSGVPDREFTLQNPRVEDRLLFTPPWRNAWYLEAMLEMSARDRRKALGEAPWYDEKLKNLSDVEIVRRIEGCRLHCTRARMSHIYRRLHPDKPSYTITGSGGGGTHVYHWEECRALTNRERARLQGFPDSFVFKGHKEEVRKQIGMAVPPTGVKIIFESILKRFAGIDYKSVAPSYPNHE